MDGQTEGRTDRMQHLMQPPPLQEGRTTSTSDVRDFASLILNICLLCDNCKTNIKRISRVLLWVHYHAMNCLWRQSMSLNPLMHTKRSTDQKYRVHHQEEAILQ